MSFAESEPATKKYQGLLFKRGMAIRNPSVRIPKESADCPAQFSLRIVIPNWRLYIRSTTTNFGRFVLASHFLTLTLFVYLAKNVDQSALQTDFDGGC
jgi:hypothetical protein